MRKPRNGNEKTGRAANKRHYDPSGWLDRRQKRPEGQQETEEAKPASAKSNTIPGTPAELVQSLRESYLGSMLLNGKTATVREVISKHKPGEFIGPTSMGEIHFELLSIEGEREDMDCQMIFRGLSNNLGMISFMAQVLGADKPTYIEGFMFYAGERENEYFGFVGPIGHVQLCFSPEAYAKRKQLLEDIILP